MDMTTKLINANIKDVQRLRNECKQLYLKFHPDMKDEKLSDSFLLRKIIDFYLKI